MLPALCRRLPLVLALIIAPVDAWLQPAVARHHVHLGKAGSLDSLRVTALRLNFKPSRRPATTALHALWPAVTGTTHQQVLKPSTRLLRVVTDIDDTVKSSGNLRLAGVIPLGGIDAQYERGQFYPGVFQFGLELAAHGVPRGLMPLPIAVLTARAKELLFALELDMEHPVSVAYRQCGAENGMEGWGLGPILYGSVKEWICWTRKSRRKVKNFRRLMELDGRNAIARGYMTEYVFIGDTGEGDFKAGIKMCENFPRELRALFLHMVYCVDDVCKVPEDYAVNGVPVLFFKTYVGAARKAYEAGLLNRYAVERVIAKAVEELEYSGAPRTSSKWSDLEADIEAAHASIASRQQLPLVPALQNLASIFQLQQ